MKLKELRETGLELDLVRINRFVTKIGSLRASQRAYFRDRQQKDLVQSKLLESEIDASLSDIIKSASKVLTAFNLLEDGPKSETDKHDIESPADSELLHEDSIRSTGDGGNDLFSSDGEKRDVSLPSGYYR